MAGSESFFAEMGAFSDFNGLWDEDNFHPAPPDWWVVITDVEGSTEAITSGRYKDVNILGAATIAALQNVMGEQAFPFVFGGDGATALIPSGKKDRVEEELCALRALAEKIIDFTNSSSRIVSKPLPEDDPKIRLPDITKARTLLGWEPTITPDEGLRRTIDWFSNDPDSSGA